MNGFNEIVCEFYKTETDIEQIKLYDCEINVQCVNFSPFQKLAFNNNSPKDWIIEEYQNQAQLIKMCIENNQACLVYGDVGIGKTTLIEKLLLNKFDFIRLANTQPDTNLNDILLSHSPLIVNRKNSSINGHRYKYIYFIDDLNLSYSCCSASSSLELARQLLESNTIYLNDLDHFLPMKHVNYVFTCTNPNKTPNYLPVKQSLTKNLICVNMNTFNEKSLIENIFLPPVQNWLEEFPSNIIQYPFEMSQSIIKSLIDIYQSINAHIKHVPSKPYYLFNFKDLAKVIQGIQLLASKSKVLPTRAIKKRMYF